MNRFYISKEYISKDSICITEPSDVKHLLKVLRLERGEEFFITDGEGGSYLAVAGEILKNALVLKIIRTYEPANREERKLKVALGCAVPKLSAFEDIVDKATQMEVDEIIPLFTERTLVSKEMFEQKMQRLQRLMTAAMKQSGALFVPQLRPTEDFRDLIKRCPSYDLCLLPNLSQQPKSLKDALTSFKGSNILVLIGPEGDFSAPEIKEALEAGCIGVSLGTSVLRVDTAAIATVGFIKMFLGY